MANRILQVCKLIPRCTKSVCVVNNGLLIPQNPFVQNVRSTTSFFMKRTASELWKSVMSVSNAGKRRGRGKNMPRIKSLNRGQKFGQGKIPIIFPGLNSPIIRGETILQRQQLTETTNAETQSPPIPKVVRVQKTHPLKRGWTSATLCGRTLGPPDPVEGDTFNGFESWILHQRTVSVMTSNLGRSKICRTIVLTGNRNGLAGFSMLNGKKVYTTVHAAKNKAGQRLIFFPRYNDHTVMHDFYTQFGSTKIYVEQKYKGYGLKCHRVIKACCEAIGITDLYAKVEGAINTPHIVKAFFIGLLQQKTFQQLANEKQLHLVELRSENSYFPKVLASPAEARSKSELVPNEMLDLKEYIMNGKIFLKKNKNEPFYMKLPSWSIHLRKMERRRGHFDTMIKLKAEHGDICSFHAEKYPEARASKWRKHDAKNEEASEAELCN